MLAGMQQRARSNEGFTLIELLVVILIIGILAAIAIPAFLGQREQAQDASSKSESRNAATAMETYYSTEDTYAGADVPALKAIEPQLNATTLTEPVAPGADSYSVRSTHNGRSFTIAKAADGSVLRTCSNAGSGGCRSAPDAEGNSW